MMRKLNLLLCLCIILVLSSGLFASQRMVVAELTTNTSCSGCYYANNTLDQISNIYDENLGIIRYHGWWPSSSDPFYQYNVGENSARINYYGADYAPHLRIDGTVDGESNYSTWQTLIGNEIGVASPLELILTGTFNSSSRTGTINVRIIATGSISYSNLKLRIALTESNIYFSAPNGSVIHHQTFRDMIPSTSGQSLTISIGDTLDYSWSFNCPAPLNYNNCQLVAFVQSDSGHRILQGSKIDVMDMNYVLNPFTLISPLNGTAVPACNQLFTWHATSDPDSGYPVSYQLYLSHYSNFSNPIMSPAISDTTWQNPNCLMNDSTYYWKVLASNGHAPDRYSTQTFTFIVDEGEVLTLPEIIADIFIPQGYDFEGEFIIENDSPYDISYSINDSSDMIEPSMYSGELPAFSSDSVGISISAFDMPVDEYSDTVYIETTHPVDYLIRMPLNFTVYMHGDVNCDNQIIGSDVTYLVNYFRGLVGPACDPFLRADTNGDCNVIGSDVTYLVNYFRGMAERPSPGNCSR
jgi:hypothetical protein